MRGTKKNPVRYFALPVLVGVGVLAARTLVAAHEGHAAKLPAGPVRDRYVLMEEIGDHAKQIGDALKAGKTDGLGDDAAAILERARRVTVVFEKRELHPDSRAKEEIWARWEWFDRDAKSLAEKAQKLVEATGGKGDVGAAANAMFEACKTCHDAFRAPEKK